MSKKSRSTDNSAMGGLFRRLEVEFFYGCDRSGWSLDRFMDAIDDHIHWYNEKGIKLSLRERVLCNTEDHRDS